MEREQGWAAARAAGKMLQPARIKVVCEREREGGGGGGGGGESEQTL